MSADVRQYRIYSLLGLGLVAVVSSVLFAGTAYFNPNRTLRNAVASLSTVDYLANLRGRTEFGCRSFLDIRPDVLFVGDSHTYSAFRFDVVGPALGLSVSACALGGFYIESFPLVVDAMKAVGFFPKVIVLGVSPRQFVEGRDKQSALDTHKFYLSTKYTVRDFVQDVLTAKVGKTAIETDLSHAEDERVVAQNKGRLANMASASATAYIASHPNKSQDAWREWTKNAVFAEDVEKKIDAVCDVVRQNRSKLYVVDIPESPFLRTQVYTAAITQAYDSILNRFRSCTDGMIVEPADYYGVDDRYFLNRQLRDDFSFEKIARGEKIAPDQSGYDLDYDLDHMNLVGATLFSTKIIPALQNILKDSQKSAITRRYRLPAGDAPSRPAAKATAFKAD